LLEKHDIVSASAKIGRGCSRFYRREAISRVTSRHLQINGPVDGNRLILHHLPLERTVARSTWPAATLNLARRHRHFEPFKWKPPGCFFSNS
ncbi:hypothetical protein ALC56_00496, partial [Trachymyrmex septentrionalis]